MPRFTSVAAAVVAAQSIIAMPCRAADDVAELRAAVEQLKAEYQQRIGALEQRIAQLEAAAREKRKP